MPTAPSRFLVLSPLPTNSDEVCGGLSIVSLTLDLLKLNFLASVYREISKDSTSVTGEMGGKCMIATLHVGPP
jgi:hypothetical protein